MRSVALRGERKFGVVVRLSRTKEKADADMFDSGTTVRQPLPGRTYDAPDDAHTLHPRQNGWHEFDAAFFG